jgi:hypothetical protein
VRKDGGKHCPGIPARLDGGLLLLRLSLSLDVLLCVLLHRQVISFSSSIWSLRRDLLDGEDSPIYTGWEQRNVPATET